MIPFDVSELSAFDISKNAKTPVIYDYLDIPKIVFLLYCDTLVSLDICMGFANAPSNHHIKNVNAIQHKSRVLPWGKTALITGSGV